MPSIGQNPVDGMLCYVEETMRCRIYTDGSYDGISGVGSWANIITNDEQIKVKTGIKQDTTNNQVELLAVLNALEYAVRKHINDVEIITDSMYVLNGVQNNLEKWVQNNWVGCNGQQIKYRTEWQGIQIMLQCMAENKFHVRFSKVKSHSGNALNEYADEQAKQALVRYNEQIRRK